MHGRGWGGGVTSRMGWGYIEIREVGEGGTSQNQVTPVTPCDRWCFISPVEIFEDRVTTCRLDALE
jgi:hypothetical protein